MRRGAGACIRACVGRRAPWRPTQAMGHKRWAASQGKRRSASESRPPTGFGRTSCGTTCGIWPFGPRPRTGSGNRRPVRLSAEPDRVICPQGLPAAVRARTPDLRIHGPAGVAGAAAAAGHRRARAGTGRAAPPPGSGRPPPPSSRPLPFSRPHGTLVCAAKAGGTRPRTGPAHVPAGHRSPQCRSIGS